jgi:multidrug efflux system membrane fusion protein
MRSVHLTKAALLLTTVLSAAGCGYAAQANEQTTPPAQVKEVKGSDESQIVVSKAAAERIGLQVAPVQAMQMGRRLVVRGDVLGTDAAGEMWIRVPVRSRELAGARSGSAVRILAAPGVAATNATIAAAAPRGVSTTGRALYVKAASSSRLRPGQAVRVRLELSRSGVRKTVPYSAVIYWIDGGTWVYERTAPLTFVRHPITVESIDGDVAVLSKGPAIGAEVVAVGGVELLGTEFEIEGE